MSLSLTDPDSALRPQPRNCQELRTARSRGWAQHYGMPSPRSSKPPIRVLLISSQAGAREALGAQVQAALPADADLQRISTFSDAVLRLAQGDIQLVLLDMANLAPLSPAAPLMLRGLAPGAHLLALGTAGDDQGFERLADVTQLPAWLSRWR